MHPRLAELADYLSETRAALLASVEGAPPERLRARPAPGAWSAAEILDHVRKVERGVATVLARALGAAQRAGPERSTSSVTGSLDAFGVAIPTRLVSAPEFVLPHADADPERALTGLVRSREELTAAIAALDGLALGEVRVPNAALGELDLYQWILFAGQHEARHTRQIRRTLDAVAAPARPPDPDLSPHRGG